MFTRISVRKICRSVEEIQRNKLENLSRDQERPLFKLQNTVRLFELDIVPPKYVIETLSLGPKNSVLTNFDQKKLLAEIDILLSKLEARDISNETVNDISAATLKYIKTCSKQKIPRHLQMMRRYLKEHDLLAVPFDKGIGICLMKVKEKLLF